MFLLHFLLLFPSMHFVSSSGWLGWQGVQCWNKNWVPELCSINLSLRRCNVLRLVYYYRLLYCSICIYIFGGMYFYVLWYTLCLILILLCFLWLIILLMWGLLLQLPLSCVNYFLAVVNHNDFYIYWVSLFLLSCLHNYYNSAYYSFHSL